MSVAELARSCREETSKFVNGRGWTDAYCYELFRRAVVCRDALAWDGVVAQYRGIVLAYVRQHPARALVREEEEFWVNRTFQRFWLALGADRFGRFPDLASLLKYLKLCAHSVFVDQLRSQRSTVPLEEVPPQAGKFEDAELLAVDRVASSELWEAVKRTLPEESERLVAYLSLARDWKPSEIHARHTDRYPSVTDVYRIKRTVLERLRRSPEIREFLVG
jgi:DNA-directed RNA polymerase specialized sigma24 family protein